MVLQRRSFLPAAAVVAATFIAAPAWAQMGVGTTTPNAKAALDIQAADKGLLIPRLDSAQRAAITAPPDGLMVFQKNGRVGLWYAFGGTWFYIPDKVKAADNLGNHTATQALNLQGNALRGTGASISGVGIGVRADGGLNIGQNTTGNTIAVGHLAGNGNTTGIRNLFTGYQSGFSNTTGGENTFSGYNSGFGNTTGSRNIFIGPYSGLSNGASGQNLFIGFESGRLSTAGGENTFTGYQSGYGNSGSRNLFVGSYSGFSNGGDRNVFTGFYSGFSNSTGGENIFSGYQSGYGNTTGSRNIFIGSYSGFSNGASGQNLFIGYESGRLSTAGGDNLFAGYQSGYGNSGSRNLFVGSYTGFNNAGDRNVYLGFESGRQTTTGSNNHFYGYQAGYSNVTGSNNTAFGYQAGPTAGGLTNAGALGYNARVSQSSSLVLGGTGADAVSVGIGTTAPSATLHVVGGARITGLTTAGVVTTDAAGNLASQSIASVQDNLGTHAATQNLTLNTTNDLLLRDAADLNHGLGWYGTGKLWNGTAVDGPALYGFNAGVLGTNAGGTRTTALYWNNAGNVGLGTVAPITRLSINPTAIEPKITLWDGGNPATHYGFSISGGQLNYHVNSSASSHVFYAGGKNGDGTELLRVRGDGNVGIGTNDPTQKLDVAGTARLRGLTTAGVVTTDASGNLSSVAASTLADNLGNHIATTTLNLQGNALTGSGASIGTTVGVGVRADGGLNLGQNTVGNTVSLGYLAGQSATGSRNLFVGYWSGRSTTSGFENTFVGFGSGVNNTTGADNVFLGHGAGGGNASGRFNTAVGANNGGNNASGQYNTIMGFQSAAGSTAGSENVFIGANTALNNAGSANTAIGTYSHFLAQAGNNNTAVGNSSGYWNRGNNNTALGYNAGPPNTTPLTNTTAIGANAQVTQSNSMVLGGTGADAVNVGIGTTAPNSTLHVTGSISLAYTNPTADLVLTAAHHTVRRFGGCNIITLPQPSTCTGRIYVLINSNGTGSNVNLTVTTSGVIYDDVTNATITALAPNNRIEVQSDGANWIVIGR